jgi:hypothetical protein
VSCITRGSVSAVVEIGKDKIDSEFDSRFARTFDKMAPTTKASQTPRPSPSVFVFINNATAYRCHICRAAITQVISAIREFMNRDFLANRRESRNQCSLESRPVRGLILKTKVFGAVKNSPFEWRSFLIGVFSSGQGREGEGQIPNGSVRTVVPSRELEQGAIGLDQARREIGSKHHRTERQDRRAQPHHRRYHVAQDSPGTGEHRARQGSSRYQGRRRSKKI